MSPKTCNPFAPFLLAATLMLAAAGSAHAQNTSFAEHPGYLDISSFLLLDDNDVVTEINLRGSLLKMVAAAARNEDPDFARAIENLQLIQVRVVKLPEAGGRHIREGIAALDAEIDLRGWERVVKHREGETQVSVNLLPGEGSLIEGLAVLVNSPEEAVVVNIVGSLDMEAIASVGAGLNIDILEDMKLPNNREDDAG